MTTVKPVDGSFFLSCSTCRLKSASVKVSTGVSAAGVASRLALPRRAFAEGFNLESETANHAARGISSRIWPRLIIKADAWMQPKPLRVVRSGTFVGLSKLAVDEDPVSVAPNLELRPART